MKTIIESHFSSGFSVKDGEFTFRVWSCKWHDSDQYAIVLDEGIVRLINRGDSADNFSLNKTLRILSGGAKFAFIDCEENERAFQPVYN